MTSALESLERLRSGNQRFVTGHGSRTEGADRAYRTALVDRQEPFAAILGCSDSRVPVELVFDQGLGDLFVIRVAGNIAEPSQIGSVEFAAERFGTRLVVVLGHSHCGAVTATLEELEDPTRVRLPNLQAIINRIRPAVQPIAMKGTEMPAATLLTAAVRANIRASAEQLRHGSSILERLIREDGLLVVGAEYSLETGTVDFFDGVPEASR